MSQPRPFSVLLLIVSSLAIGFFGVPHAAAQADAQVWDGVAELDGGLKLDMILRLSTDSTGEMSGVVDIPMQGFEGVAITELEFAEGAIRFMLPFPGMREDLIPTFNLTLGEDRKTASGVMRQAGREFPISFVLSSTAELEAKEQARRPQTPRPPFAYRNIEVTIPVSADGAVSHELAGTLTLPDPDQFGDGPFACAVLLTGSGPQDRDETIADHKPFAVIADALAKAGVASLRCDERGIGASTGDFAAADTHDYAVDAVAQVAFAAARSDIDADRVGLIGHSEGGLTGSVVAAGNPDTVAFLASVAGMGLTGRETLLGQAARILEVNQVPEEFVTKNKELQVAFYDLLGQGAPREEVLAAMRAMIIHQLGPAQVATTPATEIDRITQQQMAAFDSAWMQTLLTIDPASYYEQVRQPVLVMNGELDVQVLPDANINAITAALEKAGNDNVTVRRFEGLNHLFQNATTGAMQEYEQIKETFDPDALRALVDWVVGVTSDR